MRGKDLSVHLQTNFPQWLDGMVDMKGLEFPLGEGFSRKFTEQEAADDYAVGIGYDDVLYSAPMWAINY